MGRSSYQSNKHSDSYYASKYPGFSKREVKRERAKIRKELEIERISIAVTAAKAAKGPTPGQRMRRVELLAKKADYLKKFTATNSRITALKIAADGTFTEYEKAKEEKRHMENEYREILTELDRIPAEPSGSRHGMLRPGGNSVEEGNNVKQPEEDAIGKETGVDLEKEEGSIVKEEVGVAVKDEAVDTL